MWGVSAHGCRHLLSCIPLPESLLMNRLLPRLLLTPAVAALLLWMLVPLVMSVYFSVIRYNLMQPEQTGFIGFENFEYFQYFFNAFDNIWTRDI